ncbi:hypothetical protein [Microbispora sp. ATCC PTA-5024]|uniref:hypothetical protein n=1 Tax=Microbispora sp. ATCC PTA-5024 TaxID=316330 RepID=UPI0003DBE865|nr:hypothetical protein [Microbispora sp. ATCC PTA-5024]ETK31125.1 hypothetical protein MPTA5024_36635 [Microbispora sp. ATCC PTA-5024]
MHRKTRQLALAAVVASTLTAGGAALLSGSALAQAGPAVPGLALQETYSGGTVEETAFPSSLRQFSETFSPYGRLPGFSPRGASFESEAFTPGDLPAAAGEQQQRIAEMASSAQQSISEAAAEAQQRIAEMARDAQDRIASEARQQSAQGESGSASGEAGSSSESSESGSSSASGESSSGASAANESGSNASAADESGSSDSGSSASGSSASDLSDSGFSAISG